MAERKTPKLLKILKQSGNKFTRTKAQKQLTELRFLPNNKSTRKMSTLVIRRVTKTRNDLKWPKTTQNDLELFVKCPKMT